WKRQLGSRYSLMYTRAVKILAQSKSPQAMEALIAELSSQLKSPEFSWEVRDRAQQIVEALGQSRDLRAVDPLIALLQEDGKLDQKLVKEAIRALGKIGGTRVIEFLLINLKNRDGYVRFEAASALVSLGWQPQNDTQRALMAVSLQNWQD